MFNRFSKIVQDHSMEEGIVFHKYSCQDDWTATVNCKNKEKQQVLAKMWRCWNPHTFQVGMKKWFSDHGRSLNLLQNVKHK